MNRPIPGYYYDEEKKKYFKIEKSNTAPAQAAWSAENVKRRKIQSREEKEVRRRQELTKAHIKRSRVLREPLMGGFLNRSLGISPNETADVPAAAWTAGLVDKGKIPFVPSFARQRFPNMPCFYVGGDDEKTGLGVAYATLDEESLIGSYIPTDENDRIHFITNSHGRPERRLSHRHEMIRCPQMSSIKYHPPSHRVLLTSREPDSTCGVYFFSPPQSTPEDERPLWLIGETDHYQRVSIRNNFRYEWIVNQSTPAPASSDLICTIGTNSGILQLQGDESIDWVTPKDTQWDGPTPTDIFDQDFLVNDRNILFAGGRQGHLWMIDLRTPLSSWEWIQHKSTIGHLRSVNRHQVLASGPEHSMCIYDIRYRRKLPNGVEPVLTFPEYRNLAHIHIGWDVDTTRGVVAAAHDDGKVALYSLRSGKRLRAPAVDKISTRNPVKSLMFQTMPRNRHPSLFVGIGPTLEKYSFGTLEEADEC